MAIEDEAIRNSFSKFNNEKTLIDKLLARDDIDKLREIISKPKLDKEDLKQMLYLLNSAEAKLVNYSLMERYVMLKFHVWIRRAVKLFQEFIDGKERLEKHKKVTESAASILEDIERTYIESIQFLGDEYANIMRTSMSINALAFKEILTNKFEFSDSRQPKVQSATN